MRPRSSKATANSVHAKSKASAPGKIILFGEHFVVHGTGAILCAIDRRATVTAEQTNDGMVSIESSIGSVVSEQGRRISDINQELRPFYHLADGMGGVRITIDSEIPVGAGLGSSSACCVAGAAAVLGLGGNAGREDVLRLAVEAERTMFENTSGADCAVCTYGGIGRYDRSGGFVRLDAGISIDLVIADSRMSHSTDAVVERVRAFREQNMEDFAAMCSEESEIIDAIPAMLAAGDFRGLGGMAARNQRLLGRVGVSNDTLDEMVRIGQDASFGAKITGAGDGGCVIAITDGPGRHKAMERFKGNGYECFAARIDQTGLSCG